MLPPLFRHLNMVISKNPTLFRAITTAGLGGTLYGIYLQNAESLPFDRSVSLSVNAAQKIDSDYKPPTLRNQFNFVADVLEKVEKSVVNIELFNPYLKQSVSNGSGFIATDSGLVITNAHVVSGKAKGAKIIVTLPDGTKHRGVVEDLNHEIDLAIVKCDFPTKYPPLKLGQTADIRNGEFVIAMGSPLTLNNTNTFGIISNKQRSRDSLGCDTRSITNYIQTDAAITFGNSGGPLLNLDGEVIGINSMKVSAGISFAIPVDYAIDFLESYEKKDKTKKTTRKFMGVTMLTLNEKLIEQLRKDRPLPNDLTHGVLIWRVMYNSPAYLAGLHQEDIIVELNGKPCKEARDIYNAIESTGDFLELLVVRHGAKYRIKVTPAESDPLW